MTLELPTSLVKPDYAGGSILNLASSIATHFGVETGHPGLRTALPLEGVETIVIFVIDGLGQGQLERHIADGDAPTLKSLLEIGQHQTLTSVFPSTTMAAMTAIYTGSAPAESGWLGFTLWLEEVQAVVQMIEQVNVATNTVLEDRDFLRVVPNLASRLERAGLPCFAVQPSEYRGGWLDEWYWQGAVRSGYITTNTLPSVAVNALEVEGRKYVMVYCPEYDTVCHKYGPSSSYASDEISATDHALERLLKQIPRDGKTLFLVTADHGQKDLQANKLVRLEQDVALMKLLEGPPAGERVSRTFRIKPGAMSEVKERLSSYCDLIDSSVAWENGLYGGLPAQETFRNRVGDLIAVPRDGAQILYTYSGQRQPPLHLGSHGGLSEAEMRVPLLSIRL
jgi:predicted AlkP superfamily pyrophosphatase or phosphodiesterase